MRNKVPVIIMLTIVAAFVSVHSTSGQSRRQQSGRSSRAKQRTTKQKPKDEATLAVDSLLKQANRLVSSYPSQPEGQVFLNDSALVAENAIHLQSLISNDSCREAVNGISAAYSDAGWLYFYLRHKPLTVDQILSNQIRREESERASTVRQMDELRTRAYREADPIRRDELLVRAGLMEAYMRWRHQELQDNDKAKKVAENEVRLEKERIDSAAKKLARKYGLEDKWAETPSEVVEQVLGIGTKNSLLLKECLPTRGSNSERLIK